MKDIVRKSMLLGLGGAAIMKRKAEALAKEVVSRRIMSKQEFNRVLGQVMREGKKAEKELRRSLDANTRRTIDSIAGAADRQISRLQKKLRAMQARHR